ncbi:MAG: oxidoreductase, partial [Acidobacteria bacterium]
MDRRQFLLTAAGALGLSAHDLRGQATGGRSPRVGIIGPGWYGKTDLFRLIQVAPVEVVSMCDVDRKTLSDAADRVAERQASKRRPRTYSDYRKMLAEKDLDIVLVATPDHWHALALIAAV